MVDGSNQNAGQGAQSGGEKFEVPEHILDKMQGFADAYIEKKLEKLLGGIDDPAEREDVLSRSTHHLISTPERREMHRQILSDMITPQLVGKDLSNRPEKPIALYISGPMGVGKSELMERFDTRIKAENEGVPTDEYETAALEGAFEIYKKAKAATSLTTDFDFIKSRLPEYDPEAEHGYTLVRVEASAIDQALAACSEELGLNLIQDGLASSQLSTDMLVEKVEKGYEVTVVGITADPALNAERLRKRPQQKDHPISDDELARTIRDFSEFFPGKLDIAQNVILLNSSENGFTPIAQWEDSRVVSKDAQAYETFLSHAGASEEEILELFDAPGGDVQPGEPAPGV